ncbi:hypothetical protein BU25DRAFT_350606 [Macroventuria anomochaeta]|uniref:Uncharacterized protein n=1 Tax=Macroventuria anomochaeta TaxID=301207 RepID=A0ACB6RNH6_9PLEO|nr:uncharacterized protein BU25DRAFT_350606 [Macroventuria anomochaeta]KAF2623278.1 hypothetical protein BU25DRAFT_350606 [Macroventuria anomochaeta]
MCQGAQHVVANLLLCVLGLQQTSDNYSECRSDWVGYLIGSKKVIDALKEEEREFGGEASIILGWVYYFDVMARFSFRHWRPEHIKAHANELGFDPRGSQVCAMQYVLARASFLRGILGISAHAHPVVRLLAEVSEIGIYSSDPGYLSTKYQRHLDNLRLTLENVSSYPIGLDALSKQEVDHEQHLLEVTRLAGLIYLERVSRNFSGQSTKLESWTRQALSIFAQLESCRCSFALFIVSCELMKDEDRMIVLNVFTKMEKGPHLNSILETRSLVQTAWNQQDLAEDGGLEYIHKLNVVMSSRDVIPSLI